MYDLNAQGLPGGEGGGWAPLELTDTQAVSLTTHDLKGFFVKNFHFKVRPASGRDKPSFSGGHLAPKFFKVVANSKKLVAVFKRNKTFFCALRVLDTPSNMKLAKRSLISAIQIEEW